MAYTITITSAELSNVTSFVGQVSGWVDAAINSSQNRIGEKKLLKLFATSSGNIKFTNFFINPGLFLPASYVSSIVGSGTSYWGLSIGSSYTPGSLLPCSYVGSGTLWPLPGKNYQVSIRPLTDFTFEIWIYFIQGYDVQDYINPPLDDNHARLMKDSISNPLELTVAGTTVYNSTTVSLRVRIYLQNASAPGNWGVLEWKIGDVGAAYEAGFYNKDAHEAAPYFSNPTFAVTLGANPVTFFSNKQDVAVTFTCDCPTTPQAMVMKIIRVDTSDQSVDFQTNYDLDECEIITGGTTIGKIKAPFVGPTLVAGTTYSWTFNIDSSLIVIGASYRMIAIVYDDTAYPANYYVNSFISDAFNVSSDSPYAGNGLFLTGYLGDINKLFTGNELQCCIEERMFSVLSMNFALDTWKNDIATRLGITTINDPRRYMTRIEFTIQYPPYIPTSFTQYFSEIYDYRSLIVRNRGGIYQYIGSGISVNDSVADLLSFRCEWRNRYEAAQANIASLVNGVLQYPGTSNQYWGGLGDLEVIWAFTFVYDDYIVPFTDVITYKQKINVRDYVADTVLKITAQNPPFDTKAFWCNGEAMCLQGEIVDNVTINPADGYYLITNIDPLPGSISTIIESEQFTPGYMAQSTNPLIYDQDLMYEDSSPLMGEFCVDETLLALGDYKITVLAKRS